MTIDLKTISADTTFGSGAFLFGADSQSASEPSLYSESTVFGYLLGLANTWTNSQTINTGEKTASAPILDMSQTWNNGAVTFTGIKSNVTDTASASSSLLMDLQVGGSSKFDVNKSGYLYGTAVRYSGTYANNNFGLQLYQSYGNPTVSLNAGQGITFQYNMIVGWSNNTALSTLDLQLTRKAAASLRLGAPDAASPVAQTLGVQSVVAGTTNTAGANFTIAGSQGTGTGDGGSIIFQVAPAGSSGTAQNALATALTIASNRSVTLAAGSATLKRGVTANYLIYENAGFDVFQVTGGEFNLVGNALLTWGTTNNTFTGYTADTILRRDAANTLALRNGTNAQVFNIYNTYTDESNYERGTLRWNTSAFEVGTERAGTGVLRLTRLKGGDLRFTISGTDRWQINSSGHLLCLADNTYDIGASGASRPRRLYLGGGSLTGSAAESSLEISPTWDTTGTPTAIKLNVTDTASASSSLLMDLQVGGSSIFNVTKAGRIYAGGGAGGSPSYSFTAATGVGMYGSSAGIRFSVSSSALVAIENTNLRLDPSFQFGFASTNVTISTTPDTILTRKAAANLRLGAADAAAPIAQTLSVQSVVAGTTDTAGQNFTITGSQGTGSGAGGSIIFQVAPAGSSGTAQNALVTALTIDTTHVTFNRGGGSQVRANGEGFTAMSGATAKIVVSQYGLRLASDLALSWSSSTVNPNSPIDTYLLRDAANTLAQRNGTNAQAFNIYNTYTDASNYERGFAKWDTNVLKIGTDKLGTGTARALEFQTDGTTRLTIGTTGAITFASAAISGATSYSTSGGAVVGTDINVAATRAFYWTSGAVLFSTGAGILAFEGRTSSFPALKRNSTSLQARLADDSGYTNIQGKLTTETAYTAGAPTATGYIVLYDSTGTAYKVPAEAL